MEDEAPVGSTVTDTPSEEQPLYGSDRRAPPQKPSKHVCTDLTGVVFLLVNGAIFSYIGYYGTMHGNLSRISRGCDTQKRICGIDPSVGADPFVYWPRHPKSRDIMAASPMCIDACPTSSNTSRLVNLTRGETLVADSPTVAVGHICFPMPGREVGAEEGQRELELFVDKVTGHPAVNAVAIVHGYEDMRELGMEFLPIVVLLSMLVGYLFLYALNMCAACLAYSVMTSVIVTLLGGGASFVVKGHCRDDALVGFGMLILGLIITPWFNSWRSQLETAVGCIEASTECLFEEPTLLLSPLFSVISRVLLLFACLVHFGLLITSCPVDCIGSYGIRKIPRLTPWHQAVAVYSVFAYLWIVEMQHLASHYVVVWTTQRWYFAPYVDGRKIFERKCNILMAWMNMWCFHIGTVSMAAMLIAYTGWLRRLLRYSLKLSRADNPVGQIILACVSCFEPLYRVLADIKKEALMDVAVNSSCFREGAARTSDLLLYEVPAVASLKGTQLIFKICCVALVGMSTNWLILMTLALVDSYGIRAQNALRLGVICSVIGGFIGALFMHVFDAVGDTILFCFALEHRRREVAARAQAKIEKPETTWWGFFFGEEETSSEDEIDFAPHSLHAVRKQ